MFKPLTRIYQSTEYLEFLIENFHLLDFYHLPNVYIYWFFCVFTFLYFFFQLRNGDGNANHPMDENCHTTSWSRYLQLIDLTLQFIFGCLPCYISTIQIMDTCPTMGMACIYSSLTSTYVTYLDWQFPVLHLSYIVTVNQERI